jgi:hypothetical protein
MTTDDWPMRKEMIYRAGIVLHTAVKSYKRACTELGRAQATAEQPRLQKAGNRVFLARHRMFQAADAFDRL